MARGSDVHLEIAASLEAFRFNEAGIVALLHGSGVARDLSRRAIRVESRAKQYATGIDGGPNVRTGRLRGSITWRLGQDEEGVYADVGSAVEYAIYVEKGTQYMHARPFLTPALDAARSV